MAWFRLEGRGAFHHKVVAAGDEAYGAWVRAGQWSSDQLTDGFIPVAVALQINRRAKVWDKLCDVRLLHKVDGGYQVHDFLDWNPSSEVERERREATRERRREAGRIGGKKSGEVRRANSEKINDSAEVSDEARSKNEAKCFNDCLPVASDLLEAKTKQNEAPNPSPNPREDISTTLVRAGERARDVSAEGSTLPLEPTKPTEPPPPTSRRQEGLATGQQLASLPTTITTVVWLSTAEQVAGSKMLDALRGAGRGDAGNGPLARSATMHVVRELLKYSNAAGNTGRLSVDDVVNAIAHVAEKERIRLLAMTEVPQSDGKLNQHVINTVRGWRGGDNGVGRQFNPRKSKKLGQFDDDLSLVYNEVTGEYERTC
jgi:hypothetical protein